MASNIRVTELDFDQIKENLKNYLRSQPQFTDYDFDASNLSVLIDLLAYNTHYNAVLSNMVANEMFLDTAIKRSSVVSLAKNINYVPRSVRSSRAMVTVTLSGVSGNPNFITLDRYTAFNTNIDGTTYTFYNKDAYTTTPVGGVYTFDNVELYQGRKSEFYFTVTNPGPAEKYVIPNNNVDTTTIQVAVQYGGIGSFSDTYVISTDITAVDDTSKIYYLQENTEGFYEIYFGDGILGRKLSADDVVKVTYLISDGADANVSTNIAVSWSTNTIANESSRTIATVSSPAGGADKETADQVRFNSLANYSAQNRVVTEEDYAALILENLPGAQSVNVWGGENNVPPVYGKTYISVKPKTGYVLTDMEKTRVLTDIIQPRSMVTADHEFVDPEYTYLGFGIDVKFNSTRTSKSAAQISSLIYNKVIEFMNINLERFNATFYRSQLEEQLMDVDDSVISVGVAYKMQKRLPLIPNVRLTGTNTIKFPAPVHPSQVSTSYFYFVDGNGIGHTAQIRDVPDTSPPDYNGTGTLRTFDVGTGTILDTVGVINYATGLITLDAASALTINGYLGNATVLYANAGAQENTTDITPAFNEILSLDDSSRDSIAAVDNGITINVTAVNN